MIQREGGGIRAKQAENGAKKGTDTEGEGETGRKKKTEKRHSTADYGERDPL